MTDQPQNRDLFVRIWPFFIVFFCYTFLALCMTQYFGRDQLHLFFNQFHHRYADIFFEYITNTGTTYLLFFLSLFIIFRSTWRNLGYLLVSEITASSISLFLKLVFFKEVFRPSYYFQQKNIPLQLVEGFASKMASTFPSGHSLTAVIIAMMLCTLTKNRWLQLLFSCLFPVIAISRIYLSRHFAIDTIGGGLIGFFIFIFTYYVINLWSPTFIDEQIIQQNGKKAKVKN